MNSEELNLDLDISEKRGVIEELRQQTETGLRDVLSLIASACNVSVGGVFFNHDRLAPYQLLHNTSPRDDAVVKSEFSKILGLKSFVKKPEVPWIFKNELIKISGREVSEISKYEFACIAPIVDHKYNFIGGIIIADKKILELSDFQQKLLSIQASQMTRELILRFGLNREIDLHEKLNERKRMLRMVLDNVPAKIWFKDDKNNVVRLNAEAARSSGRSIEELEGKNCSEIWPDMHEQYYREDQEVFKTGQPMKGIIQHYHHKAGASGWISTDKVPYIDEKTGKQFILVISMDITELRKYQRQVSWDAERLDLIGSSSNVGLWDWPIFEEDKIWWSPVFHEMMGDPQRKDQPSVKRFQESIHPDDIKIFEEELQKYVKGTKPFSFECRVKDGDGGFRWHLISGQSSSKPNAKQKRIIGSMTDIHELKTIQLNYDIEREKLSDAYKELDRFTYVASHDLKAPLRGMSNVIDWVREDLKSGTLSSTEDHLNLLESRVDRMDMLLKDILSFSKAGKAVSKAKSVDMNILVDRVTDWMATPDGFKIDVVAPLPVLNIQETVAEQIFSNLISNAVKHNDAEQGYVKISCEQSYFDYTFIIEDNGPGIADEYRDIIFEPFKRLVTKDDVEGSGLGLSIVQKMVRSVNGAISVDPYEERSGTRINVIIPKIMVQN